MAHEMNGISVLNTLAGWDKLDKKDQLIVERETRALGATLVDYGGSRLAIGERLSNIQAKLEPLRMFVKFLDLYNFKRSTAYNHINAYKNASKWVPEHVLKVAMARNMPLLGITPEKPLGVYTDLVKRTPPPKSQDEDKINAWLDNLEESKRKAVGRRLRREPEIPDSELLLKACYRFVSVRIKKIPNRGKTRKAFIDDLAGMLLNAVGVSSGVTIEPQAPREGFQAKVGRPTLIDAAA